MRKASAVAAGTLVMALIPLTAPSEAQAPRVPKNVVTKVEFKKVKNGMDIKSVHKIFGTKGKQTMFISAEPSIDWPAQQTRDYRTPSKYGVVTVSYEKVDGAWTIDSKMAFWGF